MYSIADTPFAQHKFLVVTMVATFLLCWTLREVIERVFGLSPQMRPTSALEDSDRRLTRPLDQFGAYRIANRGSVYIVKGIWSGILFLCLICLCTQNNGRFFISHFVKMDSSTATDIRMLHIASSIASFYVWEILTDRYGRIKWSGLAHHICTALSALLILMGIYNPFAAWFALCGIAAPFALDWALAFRFIKSNEYPALTRKLFVFSFYYYLLCCAVNLTGQILLIINALNHGIEPYFLVVTVFFLAIFLYDDYVLLKALRAYSVSEDESVHALVDNVESVGSVNVNVEIQCNETVSKALSVSSITAPSNLELQLNSPTSGA